MTISIGGTIGSLIFGFLMSKFTAKSTLMAFVVLSSLAIIGFVFSPTLTLALVFAILVGSLVNGCITGYTPLTPRCTPLKLEVQGLARQSAWDGLVLSSRPFWQASSWIWALAKMICIWGQFCALDKKAEFAERGIDFDKLAVDYVAMLNRIVDAKPADMQITTHIRPGNFRSTSFSEGGYAPIAKVLFAPAKWTAFSWNMTASEQATLPHLPTSKTNKSC